MAKVRNIGKARPKGERMVRPTGAGQDIETLQQLEEYMDYGNVQGDGRDVWDDPDWGTVCHVLDPNDEFGLADLGYQ